MATYAENARSRKSTLDDETLHFRTEVKTSLSYQLMGHSQIKAENLNIKIEENPDFYCS